MSDLTWDTNRGRNGFDAPIAVPTDMSVESRNVHFYRAALGMRRGGSVSVTITGVTAPVNAAFEFVPGQDQSASELFVIDSSATTKILRCAAGSSFSSLTLTDVFTSSGLAFVCSAVSLNGKLYIAYKTGVNRLHVFDPGLSTTAVRRAGLGTPAAPTAANGVGAGTYAATLRYYRVAFTEQRSSVTVRRSLLGPSVSFTPDAAHLNATVTKPSSISESETHWELYGSTDNLLFYLLATTAVGSTTVADTADPATYANNTASPSEGANTPFPSVQALATDGKRLLGFGVYETSAGDSLPPKNGRVYFTPVLDSSGVHDDERISNTSTIAGWIDVARNAGAVDRGISPKPVNNTFYAFQSSGVYGLVPTGSDITPFRRIVVDAQVGSLSAQSIVLAQDANGQGCVYFLDPTRGPYVVGGAAGLRWCGKDVKDLWDTVNQDATTIPAWGVYYSDRTQVLFGVATGSATTPNLLLVLDVTKQTMDENGDLRGGWSAYDGDFATARCGVMFSKVLTATRSRVRVPYVGAASKLLRYDETVNRDDTTAFQSYITSGARVVSTQNLEVRRAYLAASAQSGVSVQQTLTRNFGDETARTSAVDLTPVASETAVLRKFEDAALQDAWTFQITLGDASAANVAWALYTYHAQLQSGAPL